MMRLLFPGFPGGRIGLGLLVLRALIGVAFIIHGWSKIQDPFGWMGEKSTMPGILQAMAAIAEFGGGIALILGALTPLAAAMIAGTMVVAIATVHLPANHPFVGAGGPSYELAAVYLAAMIVFLLTGPGHLSVDAQLFGRRSTGYGERPL